MSKPPKKKNSRGAWMAAAFGLGLIFLSIEVWLLFRNNWDLFEGLMNENPILVLLLFTSPLALPMVLAMKAGQNAGKKVGDEAENMARNLRP